MHRNGRSIGQRILLLLLTLVVLISFTACKEEELPDDYLATTCTQDSVDEFMEILGEVELVGLLSGMKLDRAHCYNVTPPAVSAQTDVKIFKFSDSCESFVLLDGEIYSLCESFGGYGFVNAVPWDYDGDGNLDLLVASSWGSGLHRSELSVFNTQTKESILFYDASEADDPSADLIVAAGSPSLSSKKPENNPVYYYVFSVDVEVKDSNLADLSFTMNRLVGEVTVKDGKPVFEPKAS